MLSQLDNLIRRYIDTALYCRKVVDQDGDWRRLSDLPVVVKKKL